MKIEYVLFAVWLGMTCSIPQAFGKARASPAKFVVGNAKLTSLGVPTRNVSVQTLKIQAIEGVPAKDLKRINARLHAMTRNRYGEIRRCNTSAEGHPWGYRLKFEKLLVSGEYISAVFEKYTVCAGSPDIGKVALVFSRPGGQLVPAVSLLKAFVPSSGNASPSYAMAEDRVRLDEDSLERMIDATEAAGLGRDEQCDFYLRGNTYAVWIDEGKLVLFPEFTQTYSNCQKEYVVDRNR